MEGLVSLMMGNIPVLIMMLVGVVLLVVEMYVPGFGAPGISGIALLVLSFVLLKPPLAQGLILFAILAAILCVALSICLYSASKGRLSKSKLVLNDVAVSAGTATSFSTSFDLLNRPFDAEYRQIESATHSIAARIANNSRP